MAQGSRPAWAEIDLAAITHNAGVLSRLVQPARLCAVVKAHGYGHGGPSAARAALAGGAAELAVALVDEGVELRQHDVQGPILLLSECGADAVDTTLAYGLTPTLYSTEGIEQFARSGAASGPGDAGSREGGHGNAPRRGAGRRRPGAARAIADEPLLRFEGLWTHFPVADGDAEADRAFTRGQLEQFDRVVAGIGPTGARPVLHAANTAGAIAFPAARYGMVRCGIGLYGYLPGAAVQAAFSAASGGDTLRPAMSLRARVVLGAHAGRGRAPLLRSHAAPAATLGGGNRSGRLRRRRGASAVLGWLQRPYRRKAPPPGRDRHHGPDHGRLRRGLLGGRGRRGGAAGRQGDGGSRPTSGRSCWATISYEVLCGVGPRVPRIAVDASPEGSVGSAPPPQP